MFKNFNDDNYDRARSIILRVIYGIGTFLLYCRGIDVMTMIDIPLVITDIYALVMMYALIRFSVIDICKIINKTKE